MLSVSPSFFLAAFCWFAADHGDAQAMVFAIVHGRIKAAPGRVPPITVARKAMISESPVNTLLRSALAHHRSIFGKVSPRIPL
jgi:hypothetical protein